MRSSKSRSRSKTNRPRTVGNIVNRVFDSSGPEGKVRGTPQQIIEKYLFLARDAQLSNDRVAAENFLQHAEHYTRMLGEAQRELAAEMEARPPQPQQSYQGGQNGQNGQPREPQQYRDQQPREQQSYRDQPRDQQPRDQQPRDQQPRDQQPRDQQPRDGYRDQPREQQPRRDDRDYRAADYARDNSIDDQPYTRRTEMIDQVDEETGLVETPESRARSDQRRASEEAGEPRIDAPRQDRGERPERKDRQERRPDRRQDRAPRRDDAQPTMSDGVEASVTAHVEAVPETAAPVQAAPAIGDAPAPKPRAPRKPRVEKPKSDGDATPPDGPREAAE